MVENSYIPGFSGCIEYTSVISQLIKEAKKDKKNFAAVWLDLANADRSVPHQLIESAMELYHLPEKVLGIVRRYFGGMKIRFTADDYTTSWQRVEKEIVSGCTISPILFVMGMGMVTRAAERETKGPRIDSGIYQPPIRGFMDDLTVITTTHLQVR